MTKFPSCVFLFFVFTYSCASQEFYSSEFQIESRQPIPESLVGEWSGTLEVFRGTNKLDSIPMEMKIAKSKGAESYVWNTEYKGRRMVKKPYELQVKNYEKGHFLLDEKNEIEIETYLFDNKMVSWYEVEGTTIMASYELRDDRLIVEIIAGALEYISESGGVTINDEEIPKVNTWPLHVMQRGVLERKS